MCVICGVRIRFNMLCPAVVCQFTGEHSDCVFSVAYSHISDVAVRDHRADCSFNHFVCSTGMLCLVNTHGGHMQFSPCYKKTLEAILWVLAISHQKFYLDHLLLTILWAEIYSVNIYGYPVIGDSYSIQKGRVHAPFIESLIKTVSSKAIKRNRQTMFLEALRAPNVDYLSDTDRESLRLGMYYVDMKIRNHSNVLEFVIKCQVANRIMDQLYSDYFWAYCEGKKRVLSWEELIEDDEIRANLEGVSQHLVL